ncbi:MAG: SoxR reducing system RseC family protein [Bacteroidales bacterium]|nr:SoxR reducing system RseC family protein [Bacteroidales bacterium]
MAKGEVSHTGRIVAINPQFTTVEFVAESACSACHAAGLCGMSEATTKAVQVPTDPFKTYYVGQDVYVNLKATMGLKAVWISYCIPLLILMILIVSLSYIINSELVIGLVAITGVLLYYLVIWLMRDKFAKEYIFYIREK